MVREVGRSTTTLTAEQNTSRLLLSSKHNLSTISARLRERINHLGMLRKQSLLRPTSIPIYICCEEGQLDALASRPLDGGARHSKYPREGQIVQAERSIVEHTLDSFRWVRGQELPLPMSLYLIGIFLPYRSHFNFFMSPPNLLRRLSLDSSHPESLHPCLRNACHLAACSALGGRWGDLEPYFSGRTRSYLNEALANPSSEHMTQYLRASTLMASYLLRARRLEETYMIITPTCYLAAACGLLCSHNPEVEDNYQPDRLLLPPPATEDEALDRIWLAHSIFITDHSLSVLTGIPGSFLCGNRWGPSMENAEGVYPWFKMPMVREELLSKIWQSDIHRNVATVYLFHRVNTAARSIYNNRAIVDETDLISIKSSIRSHDWSIPPLAVVINDHESKILFSHATLFGSSAILHSLYAGQDLKARSEMLRCVETLVGICKQLRGHEHLRSVHSSIVPMVHMMNAIRILAHELRRPEVQANAALATRHCHSIEILLDFLGSMTALHPAWSDSPEVLKETLNGAIDSLKV
ncbi:hypothetical protein DL93DRAFT_1868254 [Clavulina sp. PMI_390]|nr:hypothetical protein DL93DRAFT_1868254 [Clavulina sp. PMI_390]